MAEEELSTADPETSETTKRINPMAFFIELDKHLSDDSILVGDGGDLLQLHLTFSLPEHPILGWTPVPWNLG